MGTPPGMKRSDDDYDSAHLWRVSLPYHITSFFLIPAGRFLPLHLLFPASLRMLAVVDLMSLSISLILARANTHTHTHTISWCFISSCSISLVTAF
jgi:hypothetical protein